MRSASKERQQARAERMNINQSMRINRISLFTNFYSKCISFFRPSEHRTLENAQSNEIANVLEQYFREFDIRNVTVEDPEPETLLDQIATLLELHFQYYNISTLPEQRSWRGLAESLASSMNPDLTDVVNLSTIILL
jgi:hypothetical protein